MDASNVFSPARPQYVVSYSKEDGCGRVILGGREAGQACPLSFKPRPV
jgi:hypothetical protein